MKILDETKFFRTLGEMASRLIKETVDSENPHLGSFNRPLTIQEEYLRTCLLVASQVSTACDQLHYAFAYLSGYKSRETFGGEIITRSDYIAYQLENLYLRFFMIPDRSLRLTNEVFCLGLPPRECGARTVINNQHLRDTKVRKHLRAIEKKVEPYREMRNRIAHLARYDDPELGKVEIYSILQKIKKQRDEPFLESNHRLYKNKADLYISVKRKNLRPVINTLVCEVANFYDALLPHFIANYKLLK
ncbi:MAG TPA: Cthe_2314 family HEPN domain-containing protein [Synergistaceae bacterium]|nr:Cthe_2314 family HEPN domain-containing protein [Synergistaceae bacterium]